MVECVAERDGLLASGRYIVEGEKFSADVCPKWAHEVKPVGGAASGKGKPAAPGKGKPAAPGKGKPADSGKGKPADSEDGEDK